MSGISSKFFGEAGNVVLISSKLPLLFGWVGKGMFTLDNALLLPGGVEATKFLGGVGCWGKDTVLNIILFTEPPPLILVMDVLLFEANVLSTFTVLLLTLFFETPKPRLIVVAEVFKGDKFDIDGVDAAELI